LGALLAPADGHAHPLVLDRHLGNPGFLDDSNDLPDALGTRLLDRLGQPVLAAVRPAADLLEQPLGPLAEKGEEDQLLLARREAGEALAEPLEVERSILGRRAVGSIGAGGVP